MGESPVQQISPDEGCPSHGIGEGSEFFGKTAAGKSVVSVEIREDESVFRAVLVVFPEYAAHVLRQILVENGGNLPVAFQLGDLLGVRRAQAPEHIKIDFVPNFIQERDFFQLVRRNQILENGDRPNSRRGIAFLFPADFVVKGTGFCGIGKNGDNRLVMQVIGLL